MVKKAFRHTPKQKKAWKQGMAKQKHQLATSKPIKAFEQLFPGWHNRVKNIVHHIDGKF